jgi:hypothetical protein
LPISLVSEVCREFAGTCNESYPSISVI